MTGKANPLSGRPRSWWLWTAYWGALFVLMHVPLPDRTLEHVHLSDSVLHFMVYFILTGLGAYHLWRTSGGAFTVTVMRWALIYTGYAACDEWLQQFVHRTPSVDDWLADLGGIAVATGIAMVFGRRFPTRLSESHSAGA